MQNPIKQLGSDTVELFGFLPDPFYGLDLLKTITISGI